MLHIISVLTYQLFQARKGKRVPVIPDIENVLNLIHLKLLFSPLMPQKIPGGSKNR